MGEKPEKFFGKTFFDNSDGRAEDAGTGGVGEAGAEGSLVLTYALEREPALATKLRVIDRSPPFGIPPVVTPPTLPAHQKLLLRDVLLSMDQNPRGQAILRGLGIDRFTPVEDALYEDVRRLIDATGEGR